MKFFVSYAQQNAGLPELTGLVRDLDRLGAVAWIDKDLTGGEPWWERILNQIRTCDAYLFVVTKESVQSRPCQAELEWAVANRRLILPVKIGDVPEWRIPEVLASSQIIDYTRRGQSGDAAVDCLLALRSAVDHLSVSETQPAPDPAPPAPEVPFSIWQRLQPYLEAPELPLAKQEEFLREVKVHRDDVDSDRMSLVELLMQFRSRRDVAFAVAMDIDGLLRDLGETPVPQQGGDGEKEQEPSGNEEIQVKPNPEHRPGGPGGGPAEAARSKISRFPAPGVDVSGIAQSLAAWYESEKLETQMRHDGDRVIIQARSTKWARRLGAGAALMVVMWADGDDLAIEIGGSKWMDKAAAGAVAWFIAWPAIIPAAMGGWKQMMLPSRTLQYIEKMIPVYSVHR